VSAGAEARRRPYCVDAKSRSSRSREKGGAIFC
jgi:hypothetical protein